QRIEKELKRKKKAEAEEALRKKRIELIQRQAALKAKKAGETTKEKSEEDSKAEAQLGDMLSKLTSSNSTRRLDRSAVRSQRRSSNADKTKRPTLKVLHTFSSVLGGHVSFTYFFHFASLPLAASFIIAYLSPST